MAIAAISPAQPVPGQRLLIRGAGFGEDKSRVLVRVSGGVGTQRRSVWLRQDNVTQEVQELTLPGQLTGAGTILVASPEGRSGVGTIQFQDSRPQVLHVRLLPVETLVAVAGAPAGGAAAELFVDGHNMGAVRELASGMYAGPGFLQ